MRIGLHTSIARSLEEAARKAHELGANTFQIFSTSPRMWRARRPDPEEVLRLKAARRRWDLRPLVIHDNYLINLAAADRVVRRRSVAAFRGELGRALELEAEYLVAHPGSYRGGTLEEGLRRLAASLVEAAAGFESDRLMLLLENTAGAGAQIGGRFEQLAWIRDSVDGLVGLPIGFCLDTAHCLAAGYDVASAGGLRRTLAEAGRALGLHNVPVIHANDSKTPLGSRVDRHQHIGEGYIGLDGFRRILNHPKLRGKAFILETPVDREGDDRRNLDTLKTLCQKSRTITNRSS